MNRLRVHYCKELIDAYRRSPEEALDMWFTEGERSLTGMTHVHVSHQGVDRRKSYGHGVLLRREELEGREYKISIGLGVLYLDMLDEMYDPIQRKLVPVGNYRYDRDTHSFVLVGEP